MEQTLAYPIGLQDFRTLRGEGYVYIDKTRYIAELIAKKARYCFLARPRRFGKSLFLSTLQNFFEGRRELFKGLDVESMDWDWQPYPVLRLDLNSEKYEEKGDLDNLYENSFRKWEEEYEVNYIAGSFSARFGNIIAAAHEKSGCQVVILVDEYDKPLVENIHNKENIDHYRSRLSAVYSNFKSSAEHIRMVFLTGVSRFAKLSVFSDLNNLKDFSFLNEFADICGITEKEMLASLNPGIRRFAESCDITYEMALLELKRNYDGYRFAEKGSDIYNPWSLLNALSDSRISNEWNDTGFPKIVAKTLVRVNADLERLFDTYCSEDDLKGLDLLTPQPLALLYQTGYLTIKGYDKKINRFRLGVPNEEVKKGLFNVLLPYYIKCRSDEEALKQIEEKKYDRKYRMDGREIIRIGANFSSKTRCIEDWKIQK